MKRTPIMGDGDGHIRFEAFGQARPQGSKVGIVDKRSGKVRIIESEPPGKMGSHRSWRKAVASAAQEWADANALRDPIDGPVEVTLTFWKTRPKSYPRWRWLWWTTPDVDKLIRSVLDSLSNIIYVDDRLVSDIHGHKRLTTSTVEGVQVIIRPLAHTEKTLGKWWADGNLNDGQIPDIDDEPKGEYL